MATTSIKVRATPDALIKIYREDPEEVVYLDNTDENGETAPITLPDGGKYYIDVTMY